ncbi:MAG: hypothetical protein JOZ41_08310 [Chloroflexi bacterium]|nr:hypothetical protein [Chloroflexota bacterium]
MSVDFRFLVENEAGRLYAADCRGILFEITIDPGFGEDESQWRLEVETPAWSVQNVRELDPS